MNISAMQMIRFTEMDTPIGPLRICGTEKGLTGLFMEEHRHGPDDSDQLTWQRDDALFAEAHAQLEDYFAGRRTTFDLVLDREALGGTPFQSRVWQELEKIPYGTTITYGELARRIDNPAAVRAVGLANGKNPISIIVPCHRVIGANGSLTGYGAEWSGNAGCWTWNGAARCSNQAGGIQGKRPQSADLIPFLIPCPSAKREHSAVPQRFGA